jgi:triosephosphate isomerase
MRAPLIGGNWKMHKNLAGSLSFFDLFLPLVEISGRCDIVICPTLLDVQLAVAATLNTRVRIGAQNLYWMSEGAFTGEVSGPMLKEAGCTYVIVGHSERRRYFGETDGSVLKKTVAALDAGLTPIVCVGETDHKKVDEVLTEQFLGGIHPLSAGQFGKIVIAYEPVWAIGAGKTATPEVAASAHSFLRGLVEKKFGEAAAMDVRIIYGGSVKPDSAESLLAETEIDGFLIGGASLDAVSFAEIVTLADALPLAEIDLELASTGPAELIF